MNTEDKDITETKESTINFIPSPMRMVRFSDGNVVPMNRADRRKHKIYNKKAK